jgi:GAF domain-containing protein
MRFSEFKRNVDNSLLEKKQTSEKSQYLQALLEIISKINESLDIDEVIRLVLKNALNLTGFDKGSIFLVNSKTRELEFRQGMDAQENIVPAESFLASNTVIQDVFHSGQSVFIENALNNNDCRQCSSILSLELQTIFCSPLQTMNGKIGVLYIDSTKLHHVKDNAIIEIFEIMAGQVSTSINNAQLYTDLQKLSQVYTRNVLTFLKGDRNRTAAFLGIPRKKLDALLEISV